MYFWRIRELKRQLVTSPLSDREALPYLIAYTACTAAVVLIPFESYNRWDFVSGLIGVGLAILGPIWVYEKNGGMSGTSFLQRFLALGWVLILRVMAVVSVTLIIFYIVVSATGNDAPGSDWYDAVITFGILVAFYQRLGVHVRDVAIGLPDMPLRPTSDTGSTADSRQ